MTNRLQVAMDYFQRGLSVIPLVPCGKRPMIAAWEPFRTKRATPAQLTYWFTRWPNANVGIVTGAISGAIVLDVDVSEAEWTTTQSRIIPATPIGFTGRGRHVWFKHPGFPVNNHVGLLPKLDIRGDGGLVVVHPSIHPSGALYTWKTSLDTALAPVPDWLLAIIKPAPKQTTPAPATRRDPNIQHKTAYGRIALFSEAREVASTLVDRNNRLYRAALKMGSLIADGKLDRAAVESMLLEAAADCGLVADDGETQTIRTIASGINKGMESPRGNRKS